MTNAGQRAANKTVTAEPTANRSSTRKTSRVLLTVLFFASGAVGLAYEVAWTRGLIRLLGSTAVGSALVLGAFVGGLGLGARFFGKRIESEDRPLRLYGRLEIAAALWALFVLPVTGWLEAPYAALASTLGETARWALRAGIAVVLVVPGAMLLGGTLPAIERAWARRRHFRRALPFLYGINTLGAVAGALITGFFLIEAVGVFHALLLAAAVGAVVGAVAWFVDRHPVATLAPPEPPSTGAGPVAHVPPLLQAPPGPVPRGALAGAFLCGLFGLGLELAGLRVMVFFVEGFTVCFAAMLGVWIAGLGVGSLVLGPLLDRVPHPSSALCLLLGLAGATAFGFQVATVDQWDAWLVSLRGWAFRDATGEADLLHGQRAVALAGAGMLLFLPALFLGAAFPVCVRWARLLGAPPSFALGRVYLWNSLGTLAAPALVTFFLVPWHGVLGAWQLLAIATGATCLAFSRSGPPGWWRFAPWVSVGMVVLAAAFGGYRDATLLEHSHVLRGKPQRTLLEVRTDPVTTASAVESKTDGERTLYTDDFAAAATGRHSRYMRLLGHLPVLLARDPAHALVIAFGTGTTAGAVAKHPEVKRLEVAEVSRAVLDLAGHFRAVNGDVLADPRTRVLVDDGRDALLLHEPDLDVITLEPLMPYSPAGLPFYTREFYELARDRLRDGGVLCQWVPVHAMPVGLYAALLRTFFEVFPHGSVWFFEQSTALIAVKGGGNPAREVLEARFAARKDEFVAAGYASLDLLASAHVAGGATVLAQPGPEPERAKRLVTDMDPWPEFHATPRGVRTTYLSNTLEYLVALARGEAQAAGPFGGERFHGLRLREGSAAALEARVLDAHAEWLLPVAAGRGGNAPEATRKRLAFLDEAVAHYVHALERLPGESALLWRRARAQRAAAAIRVVSRHAEVRGLRAKGKVEEAAALEAEALAWSWPALALDDGDPVASQRGAAARLHAFVLLRLGRCAAAEKALRDAILALGEAEEVRDLRADADAIRAYAAGGAAGDGLLKGMPPCRSEGLASLRPHVDGWQRALARGKEREIRLAAENLLAAAAAESAQADLLAEVRALAPGDAPAARAWRAALLLRLDAGDATLPEMLSSPDAATAVAALEAAGASRALRALPPERLDALSRSPEPAVREALASALGADGGAREVRVLVGLLSDANRGVRASAVAALVAHDDKDMADYDPDGTAESWAKVQERLRNR